MAIDLKELQKLIKLCRQTGVESIKVEGIEMHLGPTPTIITRTRSTLLAPAATQADGGYGTMTGTLPIAHYTTNLPQDKIITDELTDEQLMLWSVGE